MKRKFLIPALGLLISTAAHAAVIVEGFDFTNETTIAGEGSGTGWAASSTWSIASGTYATASGSLAAGDLITTGNKIVSGTNGANIAARQMSANAPSSGMFWASIVVDTQGFDGAGLTFSNNATGNLNLYSTVFADRARFGFGINGSNFVYKLDGRGTPIDGSVAGATGAPTLLVASFDVTNGVFNMWANPVLGGASPTGGTHVANNIAFTRTGATFAGDVSWAGLSTNWGGSALDEVHLGTSFADVTAVPEPATYALWAGMIGVAGMLWRRRRVS
jgi:hypothetical protein